MLIKLSISKMSGPNWSLVDAGDSAVKGVGLRPLDFWNCGFESS